MRGSLINRVCRGEARDDGVPVCRWVDISTGHARLFGQTIKCYRIKRDVNSRISAHRFHDDVIIAILDMGRSDGMDMGRVVFVLDGRRCSGEWELCCT